MNDVPSEFDMSAIITEQRTQVSAIITVQRAEVSAIIPPETAEWARKRMQERLKRLQSEQTETE